MRYLLEGLKTKVPALVKVFTLGALESIIVSGNQVYKQNGRGTPGFGTKMWDQVKEETSLHQEPPGSL